MRRGNMVRKYFGTDGIRGRGNGVVPPELALKVGQATGLVFRRGEDRHRVVIGKDTRLSGYMIETALGSGFKSVVMDVLLLCPTPPCSIDAPRFGRRLLLARHRRAPPRPLASPRGPHPPPCEASRSRRHDL